MNAPICSKISNIFDGKDKAYIYIWVSKKNKFVYIGETNERRGSLGRARSHVGIAGTLRKQVEERLGERLETIDDLYLVSFLLPKHAKFTGIESTYRESVEYLVQIKLLEKRICCSPSFKVISNVRSSVRTIESSVQKIASEIVEGFLGIYTSL